MNSSGQESGNSNIASATPNGLLAPTGLVGRGINARIILTWNALAGAATYYIKRAEVSGGPYKLIGSSATSDFVDVSRVNGKTYYYVVSGVDNSGNEGNDSVEVFATPIPSSTVSALFVVGNSTLSAGDSAIKTQLESLNYTVVVKTAASVASIDAAGMALVMLSSTAAATDLGTKFVSTTVPVICCQSAAFSALGMTWSLSGTDFGVAANQDSVSIVDPSHILSAGFSGTVTVLTTGSTLSWGLPSNTAEGLATLAGDSNKYAIFGYDFNAFMPGLNAPARRVGFFLTDQSATSLNANGNALFTAAVRWAAPLPSAVTNVSILATEGELKLTWSPVEGARSYDIYYSTSPTSGFTVIATGVVLTHHTLSGLTNNTAYYIKVIPIGDTGTGPDSEIATGTPTNEHKLVVGVMGPYSIRVSTPPPHPLDKWDYTSDQFRATIRTRLGNGDLRDGEVAAIKLQSPPTLFQFQSGSEHVTVDEAQTNYNHLSVKGKATANATVNMKYIARAKDPQQDGVERELKFDFFVHKKRFLNVMIHFPEPAAGLGRTSWAVTDDMGNALDLFDGDDNKRFEARARLTDKIKGQLQHYWRQACVDFYLEFDNSRLVVDGFDGAGNFRTYIGGRVTGYLLNLAYNKNIPSQAIHIYLVHGILSNGGALGGETTTTTAPAGFGGGERLTVLLTGQAENDDSLTCHEVGHALKLDDMDGRPVTGNLNNMTEVADVPTAKSYLLMLHSGRDTARGSWLLSTDASFARTQVLLSVAHGFLDE